MRKTWNILKKVLLVLTTLLIILFCFGYWFMGLIVPIDSNIEYSQVYNIPYLAKDSIANRGRILAVVTSANVMGSSGKKTGYELTELSRAYYVFQANGFEVDIASPKGGKPPVVIDDEDMGIYDYAFLNDTIAQYKTSNTFSMEEIRAEDYDAIYFVGGKGAMFDFPNNEHIQSVVRELYQANKVIGAVCHGPAALVNVKLDDNETLLNNKRVSSFTNQEELLLISDAETIFPFLLQNKIIEQGALFNEGDMYLDQVSHDDNLITGQNPWSTWTLAETMIQQMGYTPKRRDITDEENAVKVLAAYHAGGKDKAKKYLEKIIIDDSQPMNRNLIAQHSIVAVMKGEIGSFFDILNLASFAKSCEEQSMKI